MKRGFTLIEMLVVIGIIAILVGAGMTSFSSATKSAQKAQAQELVSNVATALDVVYQKEGAWPRKVFDKASGEFLVDEEVAYELAKRNVMSLRYDSAQKKTVAADRFGIVSPWAQKLIGRKAGSGLSSGSKVPTGGTIKDHIVRYAIDKEGLGIVEAKVGDATIRIRATAVAWCCGADGKFSDYFSSGRSKSDDVYSWSQQQVVK